MLNTELSRDAGQFRIHRSAFPVAGLKFAVPSSVFVSAGAAPTFKHGKTTTE